MVQRTTAEPPRVRRANQDAVQKAEVPVPGAVAAPERRPASAPPAPTATSEPTRPATHRTLGVRHRLFALVALLGALTLACVGVAAIGLTGAKSKSVSAAATFAMFRTERDTYEGWLTDDDQSNMFAALAALQDPSQQQLLDATWQQVVEGHKVAVAGLTDIAEHARTAAEREAAHTTQADLVIYDGFTHQMHVAAVAGNPRRAVQVMTVDNATISNQVQADFDAMSKLFVNDATLVKAEVGHSVDQTLPFLLGLFVVGLVAALVFTLWVIKSITCPLDEIEQTLGSVADGDLSARASVTRADELGRVAGQLNAAIASQERAHGELATMGVQQSSIMQQQAAVNEVLAALQGAEDVASARQITVDTIRKAFGWSYGVASEVAGNESVLHLIAEAGSIPDGIRREVVTANREGSGPAARAVRANEVVVADAAPGTAAHAAGLNATIAFPVVAEGTVTGAMEFYSADAVDRSQGRLAALRNVSAIVSQAMERVTVAERERNAAAELRAKVDAILHAVNAAAEGDLTVEVDVAGDDAIGRVGSSLSAFLAELRRSVATIGDNAHTLASAAEELSATAVQMSSDAEETSTQAGVVSSASGAVNSNVATVATSTDQLTASITEIAQNTADAARVARSAVQLAEATNTTIGRLGVSSAEISEVVKVITSIAEQTNLLALNATIEATRAGAAGSGFAVVANEVKELAKQTARATADIGSRIDAIQTDTRGAIDAIGKINAVITEMNDIQESIAGAVEEQTATTNTIARSVQHAADGTADITRTISGVAQAAHSTSTGAVDTQRAAGDLARMAAELQQLVEQFTC